MVWQPSVSPDDVLMHSAKGTTWKKHKYIAIKNGRYIYPTDSKTASENAEKSRNRSKELKRKSKRSFDKFAMDTSTYNDKYHRYNKPEFSSLTENTMDNYSDSEKYRIASESASIRAKQWERLSEKKALSEEDTKNRQKAAASNHFNTANKILKSNKGVRALKRTPTQKMVSNGKKIFNRIKNKIKDTFTVKETRTITDLSTGKTRSTNWKPNVKTKRKISIHL